MRNRSSTDKRQRKREREAHRCRKADRTIRSGSGVASRGGRGAEVEEEVEKSDKGEGKERRRWNTLRGRER